MISVYKLVDTMKLIVAILVLLFSSVSYAQSNELIETMRSCNLNETTQAVCGAYLVGVEEGLIFSHYSDKMLCSLHHGPASLSNLFNGWVANNKNTLRKASYRTAVRLFFIMNFTFKDKKECYNELNGIVPDPSKPEE